MLIAVKSLRGSASQVLLSIHYGFPQLLALYYVQSARGKPLKRNITRFNHHLQIDDVMQNWQH